MAQKIEGTLPTSAPLRSAGIGSKISSNGADTSSPIAATNSSDSVKLTGEASNLQALQRELSQSSAIDAGRVQSVKESLQSGSYKINPEAVASRMLELDKQLAG